MQPKPKKGLSPLRLKPRFSWGSTSTFPKRRDSPAVLKTKLLSAEAANLSSYLKVKKAKLFPRAGKNPWLLTLIGKQLHMHV